MEYRERLPFQWLLASQYLGFGEPMVRAKRSLNLRILVFCYTTLQRCVVEVKPCFELEIYRNVLKSAVPAVLRLVVPDTKVLASDHH